MDTDGLGLDAVLVRKSTEPASNQLVNSVL